MSTPGFADYSAGDKGDGSYSGIWGVIAISMVGPKDIFE